MVHFSTVLWGGRLYVFKVGLRGGTSSCYVFVAFQGCQTVLTFPLRSLTGTSLIRVLAFAGSMNITHA